MAIDYSRSALAKPEPRKTQKARRKRQARVAIANVRRLVAARDGYCRLSQSTGWLTSTGGSVHLGQIVKMLGLLYECGGRSEWAHFGAQKRFKTRGQMPIERHTRTGSLMLCRVHHQAYDTGVLGIEVLDLVAGCNGRLRFVDRRDGQSWEEPT